MNKVWIAACVFVIVLIISITGMFLNIGTASDITEQIQKACTYVEKKDYENAKKTMNDAVEELDSRIEAMLIFVSHGKLDEIEETVQVAKSFLENNEIPEFRAECSRALAMLEHYREVEYPYLNNIF